MLESEEDAKDTLIDLRIKKRTFRGQQVKGRVKSETIVRSFYPMQPTPPMGPIMGYANMGYSPMNGAAMIPAPMYGYAMMNGAQMVMPVPLVQSALASLPDTTASSTVNTTVEEAKSDHSKEHSVNGSASVEGNSKVNKPPPSPPAGKPPAHSSGGAGNSKDSTTPANGVVAKNTKDSRDKKVTLALTTHSWPKLT